MLNRKRKIFLISNLDKFNYLCASQKQIVFYWFKFSNARF